MKLNLDLIKAEIEKGRQVLVDRQYIEYDMRIIYNYYLEVPEDRPERIKAYLDNNDEFDILTFLLAYLKDELGIDVWYSELPEYIKLYIPEIV